MSRIFWRQPRPPSHKKTVTITEERFNILTFAYNELNFQTRKKFQAKEKSTQTEEREQVTPSIAQIQFLQPSEIFKDYIPFPDQVDSLLSSPVGRDSGKKEKHYSAIQH